MRLVALLGVIAAMTVGCTAPTQSTAIELVWATGEITSSGPARDVAALWNGQHPDGPRVRVAALPAGADEQRQLLAVELNAGLPTFDVLDLDVIWTGEFAEQGWLRDLDSLRSDLDQATLPGTLETAVWDDTLWAAPYTTDAGLLYYRTDLLAGTPPPRTWEELIDVGRRVADTHGVAPFVADGQQNEGLTVQYLEYLWAAGGDLLDTDNRTVLLQQDPAQRALDYMRTAYRTGLYPPGYNTADLEDARRTFQSGGAVFMRSWPYAYRLMNGADPTSTVAGKVGIAPLPIFGGESNTPTTPALGGHNLAVSSHSRNPDAATEFVRFVATSPDVQRLLAQRHSLAPTLRSIYDELASDPMIKLLRDTLPYARPRPPSPQWSGVSEEIQQQVFAAYTGTQDTVQTINDLRSVLSSTTEQR